MRRVDGHHSEWSEAGPKRWAPRKGADIRFRSAPEKLRSRRCIQWLFSCTGSAYAAGTMVDCRVAAACRALLADTEQETDDPLTGGTLIGTRVSRVVGLLIIVAATVALVALTWFGTFTEAGWQRDEAEAHLEADVTSQATLFEDQVQRDLMELNQTLGVLGHAWEGDPSHFSLLKWRDLLVMTNTFSPDIYIANEHGMVRDDTVPEEVGRNVSDRDFFRDAVRTHLRRRQDVRRAERRGRAGARVAHEPGAAAAPPRTAHLPGSSARRCGSTASPGSTAWRISAATG